MYEIGILEDAVNNNCTWKFISNQNSTIYGINDAGIETFTANVVHSLVRETIQNSLDAQVDKTQPVIVEFNEFLLENKEFPDYMRFEKILNKCYQSNVGELDAERFFTKALNIFSSPLKIMRVSDYNTVGLLGATKCEKGSPWSRLVKESGSSNKGQTSGGSFGIGKSAAFACSDIRTIFYSSLDKEGVESNIGVARLVSYQDDELGGWTTGVGYYSDSNQLTAIMEQSNFDPQYSRKESGTDVYIMGFSEMENLNQEIIKSVLKNFIVSIWKELLVVKVRDERIDKSTLAHYVDRLNPYDGKEIIDYYYLLSSSSPNIVKIELNSDEYGEKYGFKNGECTLLLMEGNNLNSKIMMTRSAGMRLFDQNRISGTIDFTGILMIEGENMNQVFRKMEVPSHDAWEPGRCKEDKKQLEKIYSDLRKYLREKVKENFAKAGSAQLDAFGASDFLPDKITSEEANGIVKEKLMNQIKNLLGKDMKPQKRAPRRVEIGVSPDEKGPNTRKGNKPGKNGGIEPGGDKGFKFVDVKQRIICRDKNKGIYTVKYIVPHNAKRARLDFIISGEQSDYNLPIKSANVIEGNASVELIKENKLYLKNIQKSEAITLELNLDFNQYCLMEANYYESKK